MEEQEDGCFTFSDEDFERRYSSEEATPSTPSTGNPSRQAKPLAARLVRSRNRYMRALLRRRLSSSSATN
jgi:hypothetical protein